MSQLDDFLRNSHEHPRETILSRELQVKTPGGDQEIAKVTMQFYLRKSNWVCESSFENLPFYPPRQVCFGADAIHAFLLMASRIRHFISTACKEGYSIWWMEEGDHGGFDLLDFENHPEDA